MGVESFITLVGNWVEAMFLNPLSRSGTEQIIAYFSKNKYSM
jgi:hypothetical protein